jgi:hypothetical protein
MELPFAKTLFNKLSPLNRGDGVVVEFSNGKDGLTEIVNKCSSPREDIIVLASQKMSPPVESAVVYIATDPLVPYEARIMTLPPQRRDLKLSEFKPGFDVKSRSASHLHLVPPYAPGFLDVKTIRLNDGVGRHRRSRHEIVISYRVREPLDFERARKATESFGLAVGHAVNSAYSASGVRPPNQTLFLAVGDHLSRL